MKTCKENCNMYCECPVHEFHDQCNNCQMGKDQYKSVFVDNSNTHSFDLFEGEVIKKGDFIIEYLWFEYKKTPMKPKILGIEWIWISITQMLWMKVVWRGISTIHVMRIQNL